MQVVREAARARGAGSRRGRAARFWLAAIVAVLLAPAFFPPAARNLYFDSAAVIITVILFGKYLACHGAEFLDGRPAEKIRKLDD